MKLRKLFGALLCAALFSPVLLAQHTPESVLYRRTDNAGPDFNGTIPSNIDLEAPFGELDDGSLLSPHIDVDREPGTPPITLGGDNYDLAFVFQFYDADGVFSFTENFDDKVRVVATPIAGSTDLTATGVSQEHSNLSWNTRTFANYDFGSGGWFNAEIVMVEDGGGAQSAADIGFGYYNDFSTNTADFGGIGYTGTFGVSSGAPAASDTDANGESWDIDGCEAWNGKACKETIEKLEQRYNMTEPVQHQVRSDRPWNSQEGLQNLTQTLRDDEAPLLLYVFNQRMWFDVGTWWFQQPLAGEMGYYGRGYGGQVLYVMPARKLTVVMTSDPTPPSPGSAFLRRQFQLIEEHIIPAVEN